MVSFKMSFLQACSPLQIHQTLPFVTIKSAYIQIDVMFEQEGWVSWPLDLQKLNLFLCDFYILMRPVHVSTLCSCFNLQITPFHVYISYSEIVKPAQADCTFQNGIINKTVLTGCHMLLLVSFSPSVFKGFIVPALYP